MSGWAGFRCDGYVHMIDELSRHAGHADIIREQTDGATGD
jgi:hypothetical protein